MELIYSVLSVDFPIFLWNALGNYFEMWNMFYSWVCVEHILTKNCGTCLIKLVITACTYVALNFLNQACGT